MRIGDILISKTALELLRKRLILLLDTFHRQNALVAGMNKEELRGHLSDVAPEIFSSIVEESLARKTIEVAGELVRLAGRGVSMKDEETESKQIIEVGVCNCWA